MTILEVRQYLQKNPSKKIIGPDGLEYSSTAFLSVPYWSGAFVFTENWKEKREPRVRWMNEYPCGFGDQSFVSKEEADRSKASSRIACVKFVEVIE